MQQGVRVAGWMCGVGEHRSWLHTDLPPALACDTLVTEGPEGSTGQGKYQLVQTTGFFSLSALASSLVQVVQGGHLPAHAVVEAPCGVVVNEAVTNLSTVDEREGRPGGWGGAAGGRPRAGGTLCTVQRCRTRRLTAAGCYRCSPWEAHPDAGADLLGDFCLQVERIFNAVLLHLLCGQRREQG